MRYENLAGLKEEEGAKSAESAPPSKKAKATEVAQESADANLANIFGDLMEY